MVELLGRQTSLSKIMAVGRISLYVGENIITGLFY